MCFAELTNNYVFHINYFEVPVIAKLYWKSHLTVVLFNRSQLNHNLGGIIN